MKYLALALLLGLMQTAPPVPREAPNAKTGSNHSIQNQTTAQQNPSNSPLLVKNSASTDIHKQPCDTPANPTDHITVIVQSPASGWEKAYVIFTGLLVAVGAIGGRYAIKTLRAIERQAKATEDQLIETQKAGEEAGRSSVFARNAVMVSERADILLEAASIVTHGTLASSHLVLRYKNFGRTRAKDVRFKAEMFIEGITLRSAKTELPIMTVGAGQEQTIGFQTFTECLNQVTFMEVMQGKIKLQFEASAVYEDVFGGSYTTRDAGTFDPHAKIFRVQDKMAG